MICPMVSLDGEKVDAVILQPDSMCCFKCFKPTTAVQDELSHRVSNAPRTLSTTSDAGVKEVELM